MIKESKLSYDTLKNDYNLEAQLINNGVLTKDYKKIIETALKILLQKAELSSKKFGTSTESIPLIGSSQPASSKTEINPLDFIAALRSLSGVQDIRFYRENAVALLTLTGRSHKEATEIKNRLSELGMMKVNLQKLKGEKTLVITCEEMDKERLIQLTEVSAPSASSSTSFAGLQFRFD